MPVPGKGGLPKPSLGPRDFTHAVKRLLSMGLRLSGTPVHLGNGRHRVTVVDRDSGEPRGERIVWCERGRWEVARVE